MAIRISNSLHKLRSKSQMLKSKTRQRNSEKPIALTSCRNSEKLTKKNSSWWCSRRKECNSKTRAKSRNRKKVNDQRKDNSVYPSRTYKIESSEKNANSETEKDGRLSQLLEIYKKNNKNDLKIMRAVEARILSNRTNS